jgi:hypothetical protein
MVLCFARLTLIMQPKPVSVKLEEVAKGMNVEVWGALKVSE